jgi:hypothetical protein
VGLAENAVTLEIISLLDLYHLPWMRNRVNEKSRKYNCKSPGYIDCGIPDTSVLLPDGKTLYIEVKVKNKITGMTTSLNENQIKFKNICLANNTPYLIATGADDVKRYLKSYFLGTIFSKRFGG